MHQEPEEFLTSNADTLKSLKSGQCYRTAERLVLWAGSRPEGLVLNERWGYSHVDTDAMLLYGGAMGVYMPHTGKKQPRNVNLVCRTDGCPAGYARIEVVNPESLVDYITTQLRRRTHLSHKKHQNKKQSKTKTKSIEARRCVVRSQLDPKLWLHCDNFFIMIEDGPRTGPSYTMCDDDFVPTLVCSGPHPDLKDLFTRHRNPHWPLRGTLKHLRQLPALLVFVGQKGSLDPHLSCRFSFSHVELLLFRDLPNRVKRAHVMFKYSFRTLLRTLRGSAEPTEGRSKVSSYHLKTVLLHVLEEDPTSQEREAFELMLILYHRLHTFLQQGRLPHYFLPECDLFATVDSSERQSAEQAVHAALQDPIKALLLSHQDPRAVYGLVNWRLNELIRVLYGLETETCDTDLRCILFELDKWRIGRHREFSRSSKKIARPEPLCLINLLDLPQYDSIFTIKCTHGFLVVCFILLMLPTLVG